MKSVILACILFLPGILQAQTHLNGNVLTLSNGATISTGSEVHIQRPAKGTRYSFIYSELSLRASSEDDLPYGVSSGVADQTVTVKRFLERKGSRGSKFYVICRGSFINNAIDIENALKAGEVTFNGSAGPAGYSSRNGNAGNTLNNRQNNSTQNRNGTENINHDISGEVSGGGLGAGSGAVRGGTTTSRMRPWDNIPVTSVTTTKVDSVSTNRDSSGRFARAFKATDSVGKVHGPAMAVSAAMPATRPVRDSVSQSDKVIKVPAEVRTPEKRADIVPAAVTATIPKDEAVKPAEAVKSEPAKTDISAPIPASDNVNASAHSVSALMTLPSAESLKPKEVPVPVQTQAKAEQPSGYTKFAKLKQLKELLDAGVLTKAEFDIEKKKVLAE